jgi:hypothetical protein
MGNQTYTTTKFNGSVTVQDLGQSSFLSVGEQKVTTDVVTPKFHTRVARGEIINNPFLSVTDRGLHTWTGHGIATNSGSGSTIKDRDYSHFYNTLNHFPGSPWGKLEEMDTVMREVCTSAAANVDSDDVDGWVETGEGRETIKLFDRDNYRLRTKLEQQYRFLRKKGYALPTDKRTRMLLNASAAVVAASSEMANAWLMYRYGIAPGIRLLNDTLVKGTSIRTRRRTARASQVVQNDWVENFPGGGYYHPDAVVTVYGNASAAVRAGILYEYRSFSNKYGFNLDDLPEGFWNICPWTFVVDWFVNAGDFIGALTPKLHTVRLATWRGYHAEITRTATISPGPVRAGYTVTKDCSGGTSVHIKTVKRRVPGILSPKLLARESGIREVLRSPKVGDALALSFQLLKRVLLMKPPIRRGRVPVRYIGQ